MRPTPETPEWWSRRWRRTAAIGAVLVLLIGTHIPRLVLGPEDDGPDKLLHLTAFAIIATLVRIALPIRPWWFIAGICFGLALFDEVTQELPGLHRSFDPLDLVADAGGIALALAWAAALGPPRHGPDWWRESYQRRLAGYRLLLATFTNWLHLGVAGVLGAMVGGVLLAIGGRNPIVGPITMTVVGGLTGLIAGVIGAIEIGRRHAETRIDDEHRCLRCLVPGAIAGTACACGAVAARVDPRGRSASRRLLLPTTIILLVTAAAMILLYMGVQSVRSRTIGGWPILSWYDRLHVADAMALDAIVLGLVGALGVGLIRRIAAARAAREGVRCLRCGHDLQGTPDDGGIAAAGRCPECGTMFQRGFASSSPPDEHGDP